MFEYLSEFTRIIVTGPQRSGTTITARAIAHDTGLEYVDEQTFTATDTGRWRRLVMIYDNYVMQAPAMCRYVHEYGDVDGLAVVLVRRDIDDIERSQRRIGWYYEAEELGRYGLEPDDGPIARVKYEYWDNYQRHKITNAFEVNYNDLADHPLWVPEKYRGKFGRRQWRLKNGKQKTKLYCHRLVSVAGARVQKGRYV